MNDRFKFRVWDKPLEKYMWFKEFRFMNVEFTFNPITKESEIEYDKERYVVEQCTGIKDKKGHLIYEGDIIKAKDYGDKRIVCWSQEDCSYRLKNGYYDCGGLYPTVIEELEYEIVGNIHENKEYLK